LAWPLSVAAWEVRTLARVAAFMPKKPASMEQRAPPRKARAVWGPNFHSSRAKTTTMKPARIVDWRFRYTMAPLWISSEISAMMSVPTGCFLM
jgi:hypothetical protein